DLAGNARRDVYVFAFTTASPPDTTPPAVVTVAPLDGSTGVATTAAVSAVFSEAVDPATVTTAAVTVAAGAVPVAGLVTLSGPAVTFQPSAPLAAGTAYTVTSAGVKDLAGNVLAAPFAWTFVTLPAPDTTPPTVLRTLPVAEALDFPAYGTLRVDFS